MSKTIFLTGGTGKLGRQFIDHFLDSGARIVFTSRKKTSIDELCALYKDSVREGKLTGIKIDLESKHSALEIEERLTEKGITVDCLINNARNTDHLAAGRTPRILREKWQGEFTLGVLVPYELSLMLATRVQSNLQCIVNIASMYGVVATNPSLYEQENEIAAINYGVVKAALIHLTRELAVRLANRNIRVNAISYGGVSGRADHSFEERYARLCPMGRMLKDSEVAGAVDFLISDAAIGITGHNLVVDGGWSVW